MKQLIVNPSDTIQVLTGHSEENEVHSFSSHIAECFSKYIATPHRNTHTAEFINTLFSLEIRLLEFFLNHFSSKFHNAIRSVMAPNITMTDNRVYLKKVVKLL